MSLTTRKLVLAAGVLATAAFTLSCKPRATSGVQEIGGDPSVFSCDVARQQLSRVVPDLADAEKKATEAGCAFEADPVSSRPTPAGQPSQPTPYGLTDAADPNAPADAKQTANTESAYCKEVKTFITAQQKLLKGLNDRVDDPRDPCPRNAENFSTVWEFPTCGTGNECSDHFNDRNETTCTTCSWGDDASAITCQSEEAARSAVQIWCYRNGAACDARAMRDKIACKPTPPIDRQYADANKRLSGQYTFDAVTKTTRIYVTGNVKAEGDFFGNGGSATVKGRAGLDVAVGHEVINPTDEGTWVKRGDRIEGGYKTKYRCTLWIANAVMIGAEGQTTFGIKFLGNGVTGSVGGGGEFERRGSTWSMNRNLVGAGKTEEQMTTDCRDYMQTRLESTVQQFLQDSGLATPVGQGGAAGTRGAACFEHKDCKGSDWQRWYGHCYKTGDAMAGQCGYSQIPGGRCNVDDEPMCSPGTECRLVSWMEFLGYKFNKEYRCRYIR